NRQDAVGELAGRCDLLLVVGSRNSSNSNRLRELAEQQGIAAYLVDDADQIERGWLENRARLGVTAGPSAPEVLVRRVVERLQAWGATLGEELPGRQETITFSLPAALRS